MHLQIELDSMTLKYKYLMGLIKNILFSFLLHSAVCIPMAAFTKWPVNWKIE